MGDRFYQQQLKALGECPGRPNRRRRRVSDWTDELKAEVVKKYQEANPTPENSVEVVKELADEYEKPVNGVRMILTKAGVYVKKTPDSAASSSGGSKTSGGGGRGSKQANIDRLKAAITAHGKEVDAEIVDKLTGKAAAYLASVLEDGTEDSE